MTTDLSNPLVNYLLASLSDAAFARIRLSLKHVSLAQRLAVNEPGDEVEHVYFTHTGMISLLAVMKDGEAVDTATIGPEGIVGAMAGLGRRITPARIVVQTPLFGIVVTEGRQACVTLRQATGGPGVMQSKGRPNVRS